jgi:hypothetical protein
LRDIRKSKSYARGKRRISMREYSNLACRRCGPDK